MGRRKLSSFCYEGNPHSLLGIVETEYIILCICIRELAIAVIGLFRRLTNQTNFILWNKTLLNSLINSRLFFNGQYLHNINHQHYLWKTYYFNNDIKNSCEPTIPQIWCHVVSVDDCGPHWISVTVVKVLCWRACWWEKLEPK